MDSKYNIPQKPILVVEALTQSPKYESLQESHMRLSVAMNGQFHSKCCMPSSSVHASGDTVSICMHEVKELQEVYVHMDIYVYTCIYIYIYIYTKIYRWRDKSTDR